MECKVKPEGWCNNPTCNYNQVCGDYIIRAEYKRWKKFESKRKLPTINMNDILPEVKAIAMAWGDYFNLSIMDKVKLASDIQNCAKLIKNKI